MAIEKVEKCDFPECGKVIEPAAERPGFPQLSWCYFRKGRAMFALPDGNRKLGESWQGDVIRHEFCQEHGHLFAAMLRGFLEGDGPLHKEVLELGRRLEHAYLGADAQLEQQFETFQAERNPPEPAKKKGAKA